MSKLTLKWKLFLIANYFLVIFNFLSILTGIVSITNSRRTTEVAGAVYVFLIIILLICLASILNIFIVNRYFPDIPLSLKTRKLLRISSITMILVTALTGLIFLIGGALNFTPSKESNWAIISGIIFFGLIFLLSLFITILQFQIPGYLNKKSTGSINQLIESIGK